MTTGRGGKRCSIPARAAARTLDSGPPVLPQEMGLPARINPFDPTPWPSMVGGHARAAPFRGFARHLYFYHADATIE